MYHSSWGHTPLMENKHHVFQDIAVVIANEARDIKIAQGLSFDNYNHFIQSMRDLLNDLFIVASDVSVYIPRELNYPIYGIWELHLIIGA